MPSLESLFLRKAKQSALLNHDTTFLDRMLCKKIEDDEDNEKEVAFGLEDLIKSLKINPIMRTEQDLEVITQFVKTISFF